MTSTHGCADSKSVSLTEDSASSLTSLENHDQHLYKVRFGNVEIREYCRELGDNPCCALRGGPPISIGWQYNIIEPHTSVEDFEEERGRKKSIDQLRLDPGIRHYIMLARGFKQEDIFRATKSAKKIMVNRKISYALSSHEGLIMAWDSLCRKIKRLLNKG
mmetsp:Transcript_27780/g.63631  ORF Transcript_27780/g.63631 Transcript_27780/m.63631 type:complete len:161 (-) Transcript_27780:30-512(-)